MIMFLLCCDAIRKIMFDHNPKCGGLLWVVHGKEPSSDLQCAAISQITIRSTHGFWYHLRHKTSTRWEKKIRPLSGRECVHPHTVRCVGTLHRSRSSSLSCRLQCLASSFFTPPPTPPWKERGCVCLCEKHTWQRGRPITPPLHRPTSNPPPSRPRLPSPPPLSPPLHPTFFPSPPRGEMDLCLGLVMSLLATWGFGVQRSESGELSCFVYSACRLWYTHVKVETVFVYSSGIVYSLRSGPFIVCFVV